MKKLLLIIVAILPLFCYSQTIINKQTKEKTELKSAVKKYCNIGIEGSAFKINVLIGIDKGGIWNFVDTETGKNKKFKTNIAAYNYLYNNGWKFIAYSPTAARAGNTIIWAIFEKKEQQ